VLLARLAVREFAYAGGSVRLDELWRDCLEIFAERRSQFGWLDEIPLYRDLITPGEAPGEPAAAPEPSRASR
jgi:hypothetical protein